MTDFDSDHAMFLAQDMDISFEEALKIIEQDEREERAAMERAVRMGYEP